ncbi:MAG: redoxin domain-containing protein [Planctomycetota bacterium]|nr:redoxin domain-containing protein [Planctomycetota bacterium]
MLSLLISALFIAPAQPGAAALPAAMRTNCSDELAALETEYAAAFASWEEACLGVRSRRQRPPHPCIVFFPRYRALAEGGSGGAIPWVVSNAKDAGIKLVDRRTLLPALLATAFSEHAAEAWMEDTLFALVDVRKLLDKEQALAWCHELATANPAATPHLEVRAAALYAKALILNNAGREKDEAKCAQAVELLHLTASEYGGSRAASLALDLLFERLVDEYNQARRTASAPAAGDADGVSSPSQTAVDVTPSFWGRFKELAELGNGHASSWLLANATASGLGGAELKQLKLGLLEGLISTHTNEPWLIELAPLAAEVALPDALEECAVLLARWASSVDERTDQARIFLGLARVNFEAGNKNEAVDLLKKIMHYHADTELAWEAEDMLGTYTAPRVGEEAPDFETTDVDGEKLVLSDQRGKVVMLDFWGFW